MWTYGLRNNDYLRRVDLGLSEAFLLDYWLLLHAEETPPLWRTRPVGIRGVAQLKSKLDRQVDRSLIRALVSEAEGLRVLDPCLEHATPVAEPLNNGSLVPEWTDWLDEASEPLNLAETNDRLLAALSRAVKAADLDSIAFLLRRLAAELADQDFSRRSLLIRAKRLFLHERDSTTLEERCHLAFSPRRSSVDHAVRFPVVATPVARGVTDAGWGPTGSALETEEHPGQVARSLTALLVPVRAVDPSQAVLMAMPIAREMLTKLRLHHYVRTHLAGAAQVGAVDEPDAEAVFVALPQPFWGKKPGRRRIPAVPSDYHAILSDLPSHEARRWTAAVWHASQSLAAWSEDFHTSASEAWQSVESFVESTGQVWTALAPAYLGAQVIPNLRWLGSKVSLQRSIIVRARQPEQPDWYYWDAGRLSIEKWVRRVMDSRSLNYMPGWRQPEGFAVLYAPRVGILHALESMRNPRYDLRWPRERVSMDLSLLYGLRNSAVHSGIRRGSDRLAVYLSRLALEILFTVMCQRADEIRSS